MLLRTTNLLAHLTSYAAVVVGPKTEAATIRSIQLVGLSTSTRRWWSCSATARSRTRSSSCRRRRPTRRSMPPRAHLARALVGSTMASVEIGPSGDAAVDAVCSSAFDAIRQVSGDDHVYVGGASRMAGAFDAVEVVRQVLHTLEQQFVVVSLVRDIVDRGMSVAIGIEHGVEPLSACSVVVAPVVVDGEHLGSVGVLGPTRMNYPQALATVDVVSRAPRPPARRRADDGRLTSTSCSACRASATADEIKKAYRKGPRAAPRRQPGRPGDGRALQGGRPGLRSAVRRRAAGSLRPLRRGRGRRHRRRTSTMLGSAAGWATSSTPSSAAGQPVRGRWPARPVRPAARPGHGGRRRPRRSSRRCSAPRSRSSSSCRSAATTAADRAPARSTKPVTCSECSGSGQVRRVRQSVLGQMVTTSPCPRCGGLGEVITTPCPTCRGEGRVTADKTLHGRRAGRCRRRFDVAADAGGAPPGHAADAPGDLYVHLRVARPRPLPTRSTTTSSPRSRSRSPRRRSARGSR